MFKHFVSKYDSNKKNRVMQVANKQGVFCRTSKVCAAGGCLLFVLKFGVCQIEFDIKTDDGDNTRPLAVGLR